MRKSERFGLNLVEGSDIVNPLVQDVPNYEMIDEQMAKNADAGVPMATELLSGTVHALTRENPNASMFRFVATANFKTGDTFTVDGVQVTALLTTGEPLATGCYVINSNVLCCLVGTVLTMFCANSLAEIHAVDSDKLGGEDAEYYASANTVVEAINLAQNANQISLANREAINEQNKKMVKVNRYSIPENIKIASSNEEVIPFANAYANINDFIVNGDGTLTYNGDGCYMLINCSVYYTGGTDGQKTLKIYKNTSAMKVSIKNLVGDYQTIESAMAINSLNKGDVIKVTYKGAVNDSISNYSSNTVLNIVLIGK